MLYNKRSQCGDPLRVCQFVNKTGLAEMKLNNSNSYSILPAGYFCFFKIENRAMENFPISLIRTPGQENRQYELLGFDYLYKDYTNES